LPQGTIPMQLLREYIAYSRAHCKPELTDAAAAELVEGYLNMRRQGISRKVRPGTPVCLPPATCNRHTCERVVQLATTCRLRGPEDAENPMMICTSRNDVYMVTCRSSRRRHGSWRAAWQIFNSERQSSDEHIVIMLQVITATPRQLESGVRLAESLARMRLSPTVEPRDVREGLRLMQVWGSHCV